MEISFNKSDVFLPLTQASSIVNQKNVIPILGCFYISTYDDCAIVTSSDGETWLDIKLKIQSDGKFKVAINAANLTRALKNLDEGVVNVRFENNVATFNYNGGFFKLPYTTDGYPTPPNKAKITGDNSVTVSKSELFESLNCVDYAVANDALRLIMNGVHFEFCESGVITVASDTFKLAKYTNNINIPICGNFTIQSKASALLKSIICDDGDINIKFNESFASFTCSSFKLTTKLIEGNYPKYNVVIPTDFKFCAEVNKSALLDAVKRVSLMGNETTELVKLKFSNNLLKVTSNNDELNTSGEEDITCKYDGEDIIIGFKCSSICDVLRKINSDIIYIELSEPNRACVFHYGNKDKYLALLMPLLI